MVKPRYRQTLEQLKEAAEGKQIVFFGRGASLEAAAEKLGTPKYICDNNDELWGGRLTKRRIEIVSPLRLYREDPEQTVVLVTAGSSYVCSITRQIQEIGDFPIFYWNVIENEFLRDISTGLFDQYEKLKKAEDCLDDDRSRQVLREVVHRRMIGSSCEYGDLKTPGDLQYLFRPMYRERTETVLDCGGYIGDTAERFVRFFGNRMKKIYSFEALPKNLEKLSQQARQLKQEGWEGEIQICPYAVSDRTGTITFCETELPGGSFSPDLRSETKFRYARQVKQLEVPTRTIDQTIPKEEEITLIKMDIEGAEYEALTGARETILRWQPALAISLYHNAEDYWRIILFLKELVPEYRMAVRHHKIRHADTVLYAWKEG